MNTVAISPKAEQVVCDTYLLLSFGAEVKKVSINLHSVVTVQARGRIYVHVTTPCPGTGP
jgi:hypothetical protein